MMRHLALLILLFSILNPIASLAQSDSTEVTSSKGMNNARMDALLKAEVNELKGEPGSWELYYGDRIIFIITDQNANRMRIFSPVIEEENLEEGQLEKMLKANFHSALDAKYSLYEGFVISIFTHPLQELSDDQFIDALRQVVVLNHTFGTSYQSTDLIFPGGDAAEEAKPKVNEKPVKRS